MEVTTKWNSYSNSKPSEKGVYLVMCDGSSVKATKFGDTAFYHPNYGWTGAANTLEKIITHWAHFPWPNLE